MNDVSDTPTGPRLRHATRARIVLGLDPGTRVVGYGAIAVHPRACKLFAAGVIQPDSKAQVPARLAHIQSQLEVLLEQIRPDVVVIEQAFAARNVQSALRIGEGRGVLLATAARFGAELVQFPPAVAKKAVVGNGAADKSQVAAMIARELGLEKAPEPLDASDALGLALAFVVRERRGIQLLKAQAPARSRRSR